MQAYATAKRPVSDEPPRVVDSTRFTRGCSNGDSGTDLIDAILSRLADLVVDRLAQRAGASPGDEPIEWMDARSAAAYLGIHRDTLRKLAAQRAIPAHQDGPRCKLYFRRDELDGWRRSIPTPRLRVV